MKTGQGSQSGGHTNRLSCFLRLRLCCSCLGRGRSWITLVFSPPFDPTPCQQAMPNGKENISGKRCQYRWNWLPWVSNLLAREQGLILDRESLRCEYIWLNEWKNNCLTPIRWQALWLIFLLPVTLFHSTTLGKPLCIYPHISDFRLTLPGSSFWYYSPSIIGENMCPTSFNKGAKSPLPSMPLDSNTEINSVNISL